MTDWTKHKRIHRLLHEKLTKAEKAYIRGPGREAVEALFRTGTLPEGTKTGLMELIDRKDEPQDD